MKTIGILGGLGPESTAAYYNIITRTYYETHRDFGYPEIVILSLKFDDYIGAHYKRADDVAEAIARLHRAGADFVVAACNSIHVIYDEVAPRTPIPWISIMDATAERIREAGQTRIGLLGTVFTMGGLFYPNTLARCGIETLVPPDEEQEQINRIIYDELVLGTVRDESRACCLSVMDGLRERGAEGIVLGCTELPFLIEQKHTGVPVYDTTTIHAQKALELALA